MNKSKKQKDESKTNTINKNKVILLILICMLILVFVMIIKVNSKVGKEGKVKNENQTTVSAKSKPKVEMDWKLTLVNSENKLPDNYNITLESIDEYRKFDSRAITYLQNMINDMRKQNVGGIWVQSSLYGDLKFIIGKTIYKKGSYTNFYIVYSEDMKKICYYNFDNSKGLEPNDYSIRMKEEIYPNAQSTLYDYDDMGDYNEEKNSVEAVKNKEELIKSVKDEILKINLNIDINPNAILKKTDFYIFQDEENKLTIYYDNDNNVIFGFCIGFEY